jgi:hypothetical protein
MNKLFLVLIAIGILPLLTCCNDKKKENYIVPDSPLDITAGIVEMELWDPPDDAIHVDPYSGNDVKGDGSIEKPYKSFKPVKWIENKVYAIKRSTTIELEVLMFFADGITLASYGEGTRPIIKCFTTAHAVSTDWYGNDNITIRDVEIEANNATSCVIFRDNSKNSKLINCKLHGGYWGLRALNYIDGLYVENTEIYNTKDDGVFVKNSKNIEFKNCYVHHVNRNWKSPATSEKDAAGDGIQFEKCDNWHVHHNLIDRSTSGNKFCFISNNPSQENGIIENNWFIGPLVNGSSIYIGDGSNIIVRYNFVEGPSNSPFYSHAKNLDIYYNIFYMVNGPLFASQSAEVYNNLFYDVAMGIQGGNIIAKNNIFHLTSDDATRFKVNSLVEENNLFTIGEPTGNSYVGDPGFVDPGNLNFHLLPNSICIDNGTGVGVSRDFEGNPVPRGEATDIGVYEK